MCSWVGDPDKKEDNGLLASALREYGEVKSMKSDW